MQVCDHGILWRVQSWWIHALATRQLRCPRTGNAGSFVRLEKLQQTAHAGISVLQGLCARYQRVTGAASASQSGLVGEREVSERQAQIQLLEKASLTGDAVSSPVRTQSSWASCTCTCNSHAAHFCSAMSTCRLSGCSESVFMSACAPSHDMMNC
jgi:hypothetical protein